LAICPEGTPLEQFALARSRRRSVQFGSWQGKVIGSVRSAIGKKKRFGTFDFQTGNINPKLLNCFNSIIVSFFLKTAHCSKGVPSGRTAT
jgi:hypothetical protein